MCITYHSTKSNTGRTCLENLNFKKLKLLYICSCYKLIQITKQNEHHCSKQSTKKVFHLQWFKSLHRKSFNKSYKKIITSAITSSNSSSSLNSIRSYEPSKLELFKACSSLASLESWIGKVEVRSTLDIIYLKSRIKWNRILLFTSVFDHFVLKTTISVVYVAASLCISSASWAAL